ncbi:MAG TPA: hypothetical protein VF207_05060 [Chthoniobacterales bacterium]
MQMLLLPELASGRAETGFRSDRQAGKSESSFTGTILAGRYKILEAIEAESFKAHDLALDQTVTVRVVFPSSQRVGDIWRRKVYQLALVRNPHFLNVLDVISQRSNDFVISERPRGKSIAELLRERSHFDLEEVLALIAPLAGALDLAASFACSPHFISARWLFTEARRSFAVNAWESSLSEAPPFFVKLDAWELVRPTKNISSSFLTSKAREGGSKRLAVRQAALLTYELLGGETHEETQIKRWFKPLSRLGKAGNSILYGGLQGSPRFRTGESFFQHLASAARSDARESRKWHRLLAGFLEHSLAYPGTNDVFGRFNRDTDRVTAGLLGGVVFAALAFAVLVPERHPKAADLTTEARQAKSNSLPNTDAAMAFRIVDSNARNSATEVTSGTATAAGQGITEESSKESLAQIEATAASSPPLVLVFNPESSRAIAHANGGKWSLGHREDSARMIRAKTPEGRYRPSGWLRPVDVKRRLIALWHQRVLQSEKARNWAIFSNLNKRKKAAYTSGREP